MKRWHCIALVVGLLLTGIAASKINTFVYDATHLHARPDNLDLAFDVSPRGDQIVFTGAGSGKSDLYFLNLKTSRVTELTDTPVYEGHPAFSPDGRFIAYVAGVPEKGEDCADHLYIRSLDGKTVKQLTTGNLNDSQPAFSPDGNEIVFLRANQYITGGMVAWGQWWNPQIFTIHRDGTQLRQITDSKQLYQTPQLTSLRKRTLPSPYGFNEIEGYDIGSPQFSPDGKTLVFDFGDTRYGHRYDIASIDLTKNTDNWSQGIQLLTQDGHSALPTISPDEKKIVFISETQMPGSGRYGSLSSLSLMKPDGTARKTVLPKGKGSSSKTDVLWTHTRPKFTPDGKLTYFLIEGEGFYRLNAANKNLEKIADGTLFTNTLSWKPPQKK